MYVILRERPAWPDTPNTIVVEYLNNDSSWSVATNNARTYTNKRAAEQRADFLNSAATDTTYKYFVVSALLKEPTS